jgi:hypothetical protein
LGFPAVHYEVPVWLGGLCVARVVARPQLSLKDAAEFKFSSTRDKGIVLQLLETTDTEPIVKQQGTHSGEPQSPVDSLLLEYQDVFAEPKGFPPNRTHDHSIPLVEGAGPVSVRPYRYPFFQKGEIEKIVQE